MIVNQELVKKIKDYFNLNIYETKVWLALLSKGIASAGEIAELSGVPRSRTYDVLESLEKQGFAIAKIGKPTKYIVVKPVTVLEKMKKRTVQRAEDKVKVLDKLRDTKEYEELESLHNSSTSQIKKEELSGAVRGKSNILSHVRETLENAEKQVTICIPASDLFEKGRVFSHLFEKLKQQNIEIKLNVNGTEEELKKIQNKFNVKPQKTKLNSKIFLVDKQQVLFTLTNSVNDEEELAVWLNSDFFTSSLHNLFEQAHNNRRK